MIRCAVEISEECESAKEEEVYSPTEFGKDFSDGC